jgi:hypothetical protein
VGTTNEYVLESTSQETTKKYNPRWGTNEYNENEQGGEQMPNPACCDARKQENRSEVLQDALRAFHEQREPPRNPATEAREQKTENEQEERSSESVRQHFVLPTRDDFVFFALSFYSPSRGRLAFNS